MANITLNLCRGGLQKIGEAKHLEVTLVEYEIAYGGSVGDVSLSINIPGLFTSVLSSSTSWSDIGPPHTYMDAILFFLNGFFLLCYFTKISPRVDPSS